MRKVSYLLATAAGLCFGKRGIITIKIRGAYYEAS